MVYFSSSQAFVEGQLIIPPINHDDCFKYSSLLLSRNNVNGIYYER